MSIRLGAAGDVSPGEMHVYDVAGTRLNVANAGGHLFAFDDTCTHMGCSLANGDLDGTVVTCACHGSQFDVTSGAVVRGPAQRPVRSYGLIVEGDEILADVPEADG
jgi:nitrite reductase/ring-hydroxylating ferredoxin subunit